MPDPCMMYNNINNTGFFYLFVCLFTISQELSNFVDKLREIQNLFIRH